MDFIILKVNGTDVSSFPHEDAVQVFLAAEEPIVVEVKRRLANSNDTPAPCTPASHTPTSPLRPPPLYLPPPPPLPIDDENILVDDAKSSEVVLNKADTMGGNLGNCNERLGDSSCSGSLVSTAVQTEMTEFLWLDEDDEEEDEEDDCGGIACFDPDIDLEEVTLTKCCSDERIGLTVCYNSSTCSGTGTGSEPDAPTGPEVVYIRDIVPQSVADLDGRLRPGDQILQVNGKDVANKEETECLFAENRKAVTLLVSRCYARTDDNIPNEQTPTSDQQSPSYQHYQNSIIERVVQVQQDASINEISTSFLQLSPQEEQPHNRLNLTNSLVRSKLDSINNEIHELHHRMQNINLVKHLERRKANTSSLTMPLIESETEHIYETIAESVLESELEPIYSCPYDDTSGKSGKSVVKWLNTQEQPEEWTDFQDNNKTKVITPRSKSSKSVSSGEDHENSSSAYNTGGSSNSNPLMCELTATEDSNNVKGVKGSTLVLRPDKGCKNGKAKCAGSISSPNIRTLPQSAASETMYTNVANLQQTIVLQQQLFLQAISQKQPHKLKGPGQEHHSTNTSGVVETRNKTHQRASHIGNAGNNPMETHMEWKVKRRPDGSRYIARRPIRNKILHNRELRINYERCGGATTEDDAASELKIGRYWPKEERRKHAEKSKERKQRHEMSLAAASQAAQEANPVADNTGHHLCLVHKKTANNNDNNAKRQKCRKSHKESSSHHCQPNKTRDNCGPSKISGLLSVTTV